MDLQSVLRNRKDQFDGHKDRRSDRRNVLLASFRHLSSRTTANVEDARKRHKRGPRRSPCFKRKPTGSRLEQRSFS
jgi:hypothetical protein